MLTIHITLYSVVPHCFAPAAPAAPLPTAPLLHVTRSLPHFLIAPLLHFTASPPHCLIASPPHHLTTCEPHHFFNLTASSLDFLIACIPLLFIASHIHLMPIHSSPSTPHYSLSPLTTHSPQVKSLVHTNVPEGPAQTTLRIAVLKWAEANPAAALTLGT